MWVDLSEWKENKKIFLPHVNDHQREHFNNQVDRMTHSVFTTCQHFSSASGLRNKVAMVAEMEVMHAFSAMDFIH